MIFFLNLDGTMTREGTGRIFQGSTAVPDIKVLSVVSSATGGLSVAFTLPSGLTTLYYPLAIVGEHTFDNGFKTYVWGIKQETLDEHGINEKVASLIGNVTQEVGKVGVTIRQTNVVTGADVTSYTAEFIVEYSALPAPPSTMQVSEISTLLSLLNAYYSQNADDIRTLTERVGVLETKNIESIDFRGNSRSIEAIDESGIMVSIDDVPIQYTGEQEEREIDTVTQYLPLVAGNGIDFVDKGEVVEIKSTFPSRQPNTDGSCYVLAPNGTNPAFEALTVVKTSNLTYDVRVGGKTAGTITIPQDTYLDDVKYNPETKELSFIYNTASGEETIVIPLSDLEDVNNLLIASNRSEFDGLLVSANVGKAISYNGDLYTVVSGNGIEAKKIINLDDIRLIDDGYGDVEQAHVNSDGITWVNTTSFDNEAVIETMHKVPVVAGKHVSLTGHGETIKINADSATQIYETAVDSEGDEAPETINPSDVYGTYPAKMYDGQRDAEVGDLLIYKFDVPNSKGQYLILCKITSIDHRSFADLSPICFIQGANGTGGSGGGGGVITSFYIGDAIEELEIDTNGKGINVTYQDAEIEMNGGDNYNYFPVNITLPIVAGENVTLEKDETNNVVKIDIPTADGELVDDLAYSDLVGVPILIADLDTITPTAIAYYKHNGADETTYTKGVIYFYDGTAFKAITGGGAGGGISDVQVNGTSVVTDGVANIPEASQTQAGVVTTGGQTFKGVKTFISGLSISDGQTISVGKMGAGNVYGGLACTTRLNIRAGNISSYGNKYLSIENDKLSVQEIGYSTQFTSTLPAYSGTLMSAPSTWSTGTSGTAKLPSAGLYEIKTLVQHPNPEATYGFVIHSVIYWDGTNEASGELIRTPTISASTCKEFYVSETGVIYFGETDLDGFGGGTISTQISYRKIGIA